LPPLYTFIDFLMFSVEQERTIQTIITFLLHFKFHYTVRDVKHHRW